MRKPVVALMANLAIMAATNNATSEPAQPYTPSLVEFMMNVQSHHAKLWLASVARNWDLADYQVDELKELLEDIAKRVPDYKGTPVGKMIESTTSPRSATLKVPLRRATWRSSRRHSTSSQRPAMPAMRRQTAASSSFGVRRHRRSQTSYSPHADNRPAFDDDQEQDKRAGGQGERPR
jgi:hypothetical protein